MLRYGVELPVGAVCADPRVLAEFAAAAERAGWDGVFLEDYIVYGTQPDCPTCDPWIALAAMALATQVSEETDDRARAQRLDESLEILAGLWSGERFSFGIRDFVERERGSADGFDIVIGGRRRGPDWDAERRYIRSVAEAGATWWGEWVPPGQLEQMRHAVEAGPLTV